MTGTETCFCIGAAHWDVIGRLAADGADAGGDRPGTVVRKPGGVALNSAFAFAASGLPVALCAAVGQDTAGQDLVTRIKAAGVGCAGLLRPDGATDSYVGIETSAGSLLGAVADCRLLERHGLDLALHAADVIRSGGPCQVVVDGNLPEPAMQALLKRSDHPVSILAASPTKAGRLSRLPDRRRISLYANRREAEILLGGDAFPDAVAAAVALRDAGFASATITDGSAEAACAGPGFVHTAVPPRVSILRITGAGDVFAAAHLSALAKGAGQDDALHGALKAAARHISTDST